MCFAALPLQHQAQFLAVFFSFCKAANDPPVVLDLDLDLREALGVADHPAFSPGPPASATAWQVCTSCQHNHVHGNNIFDKGSQHGDR